MARTILRGVRALLGHEQRYEARPLDIVVEGDRIAAIMPEGQACEGEVLLMPDRLVAPEGQPDREELFPRAVSLALLNLV